MSLRSALALMCRTGLPGHHSRYTATAALSAIALVACAAPPRTGLTLRLETDLGADLRRVEVFVTRNGFVGMLGTPSFTRELSSGERLPADLGIAASQQDDAGSVYLRVRARLTTGASFDTLAQTRFLPGQQRVLTVYLARACSDEAARTRCEEMSGLPRTCSRGGSCEVIERDPVSLPLLDGGGFDATALDAPRDVQVEDVRDDLAGDARDEVVEDVRDELPPPDAGCDGSRCGASCVDLQSDVAHCGMCGRDCRALPGVRADAVRCVAGACELRDACAVGRADCDPMMPGCETSVTTPTQCGACGVRCAAPTPLCTLMPPTASPDGGLPTSPGIYACGSACSTLTPDLCAGACVSRMNDVAHCGACGNACGAQPNAHPACAMGRCSSICDDGFGDCDGASGNGCEAPLTTTTHCGRCGNACAAAANATATCSALGTCELTCAMGFGDCNGMAADGCELPLNSLANCGACGRGCMPANGTGSCASSVCAVASCNAGFGNCNMDASDGCETPTTTDVNQCGSCGRRCTPPANATAACAAGSCDFTCNAGFMRSGATCVGLAARPLGPLSGSVMSSRRVTLRWQNAMGATGVRVELCSQLDCSLGRSVLSAMDVTGSSVTLTLPAGANFWRLRSLGDSERTGPAGPVWTLLTRGGLTVDAHPLAMSFVGNHGTLSSTNYSGASFAARLPSGTGFTARGIDSNCSGNTSYFEDSSSIGGASAAALGSGNGSGITNIALGGLLRAPRGAVLLYRVNYSASGSGSCFFSFDREIAAPTGLDAFGYEVVGLGDTNGDGYADLGVLGRDTTTRQWVLAVHRGSATDFAATPSQLVALPMTASTYAPTFAAADVNGDDLWDLVVGLSAQGNGAGTVLVYHGGATGLGAMPATALPPPMPMPNGRFGAAVSASGDVTGDGIADLVVGAPGSLGAGLSPTGGAWLYNGGAMGIEQATMRPVNPAPPAGARFGEAVQLLPDLNGDGFADLAVGAPGTDDGFGTVFVYLGVLGGLPAMPSQALNRGDFGQFGNSLAWAPPRGDARYDRLLIGLREGLTASGVESAQGSAAGVASGDRIVAMVYGGSNVMRAGGAGDVNGDGVRDVVLASGANVYFYSGQTPTPYRLPTRVGLCGSTARSVLVTDLNNDNRDDVVVASEGSTGGQLCVFLGTPTGIDLLPSQVLGNPDAEAVSNFGLALVSADFNGDNLRDVAVGSPNGGAQAGRVYLFLGTATGLSTSYATRLVGVPATAMRLGWTLAAVPDQNADGLPELAVGIPGQVVGAMGEAGAVRIYRGANTPAGLAAAPAQELLGMTLNGRLGYALAVADVHNDGRADLLSMRSSDLLVFPGVMGSFGPAPMIVMRPANVGGSPPQARLVAVGDVDNDDFDDVLQAGMSLPSSAGVAVLYRGGAAGLTTINTQQVVGGFVDTARRFASDDAAVFAAGDLTGDGLDDVVLSAAPPTSVPNAWLFAGVNAGAPRGLRAAPSAAFSDANSVLSGAGVYLGR